MDNGPGSPTRWTGAWAISSAAVLSSARDSGEQSSRYDTNARGTVVKQAQGPGSDVT